MLGGFVHVEVPLNLSEVIETMKSTCKMIHAAAFNPDLSTSGGAHLRHAMTALDDDCKSEEIALSSLVKALGTKSKWEDTFGEHRRNPFEIERRVGRVAVGMDGAGRWKQGAIPPRSTPNPDLLPFAPRLQLPRTWDGNSIANAMPSKVQPEKYRNYNPKDKEFTEVPSYVSGSYISWVSDWERKFPEKTCSSLDLYRYPYRFVHEYQAKGICSIFYLPEFMNTPYNDGHFFDKYDYKAWRDAGDLLPIRQAYFTAYERGYRGEERNKRQLLVAGMAAAGAVMFQRVASDLLGWLGFYSESPKDEIKRINENAHHSKALANHLGRVEFAAKEIKSVAIKQLGRMEITQHVVSLASTQQSFLEKIHRVTDGLHVLLHQRQLSPSFVDTHELYRCVQNLEMAAGKRNEMLLIESYSALWTLEASYFVMKDLTMMIVLHIPVGRVDSRSNLYR